MYRAIVRRKVTALFAAINAGDVEPVLHAFAPRFDHAFLGSHALSGSRHSLAATRAWYERLFRLLPGLHFTLHAVHVHGTPWNTLVTAEWTEHNEGADGVRTTATGVHLAWLSWGRMTRLLIVPDTARLEATLARLCAAGFDEAAAAPIAD